MESAKECYDSIDDIDCSRVPLDAYMKNRNK